MSGEPVNIMGVLAFPDENGKRDIRFIDSRYNTLFTVPDGENIVLTHFDGRTETMQCRYIDDAHARIGQQVFHICQFAELQEKASAVYAPEHPREGDICDTYTVYQLRDTRESEYAFRSYDEAKPLLRREDYDRVYTGVLAQKVTLEDLFSKHNRDDRPFGQRMRSLSMSDIVVLDRGGVSRAYYVDCIGFAEAKEFLASRQPAQRKSRPRQKRGGESR